MHKIGFATVSLHISAVLYGLLAVACLAGPYFVTDIPENQRTVVWIVAAVLAVISLALVVGVEFVAYGLRKRKFWAWVAGLCIFGLYVPSLFLPLGAFGLWGLLAPESRKEFDTGTPPKAQGGA